MMVVVHEVVHPFAPVTVTVYVPEAPTVAVAVVCAGVVFQEYVYGDRPPDASTVTDALVALLEQLAEGAEVVVRAMPDEVLEHTPEATTTV